MQKVKISEDKPLEQIPMVIDKDKLPVTTTLDSEIEHIKAKKRKLQMQGVSEDTPLMKMKKKALTVKALLEEKRVTTEPSGQYYYIRIIALFYSVMKLNK